MLLPYRMSYYLLIVIGNDERRLTEDGSPEPVALGGRVRRDGSGAEQWPLSVLWTGPHLPHVDQRVP